MSDHTFAVRRGKARKPGVCDYCGDEIATGDAQVSWSGVGDDGWWRARIHAECEYPLDCDGGKGDGGEVRGVSLAEAEDLPCAECGQPRADFAHGWHPSVSPPTCTYAMPPLAERLAWAAARRESL